MKEKARALRKSQTDAERLVWRHLRNRRLAGCKFRRQHPIGCFIVDFACLEKRLVVELDGGQHAVQVEHDGQRSMRLESWGYRVIRFWNNQVLEDVQAVMGAILEALETKAPSPRPSPPKKPGEREQKATQGKQLKAQCSGEAVIGASSPPHSFPQSQGEGAVGAEGNPGRKGIEKAPGGAGS